jgi:hypothetical protein
MKKWRGDLRKLKLEHSSPVNFEFILGENKIAGKDLLGKKLKISYHQEIHCIHSGELTKKSFFNGYSYKSFMTLPECDQCMVKPELCHFAKGTCRDSKWGEENCNIPHIIYLAWSSDVKIGITRERNLPYRWLDQGAIQALPILRVKDRLHAGLIEIEISKIMKDKTDWRKMLVANECSEDLISRKEDLFFQFGDLFDDLGAQEIESGPFIFSYPLLSKMPDKIEAFDFEKELELAGRLIGIKGSYLIFEQGQVLNTRKFQGYNLSLEILD